MTKMTYLRNFLGLTIAVGFGVWNASYALKPALEEEASKRTQLVTLNTEHTRIGI